MSNLSISVVAAALLITAAALPNGVDGSPYNSQLSASGDTPPYASSLVSGSLPSSVVLPATTRSMNDTPSTAATLTPRAMVTDSAAINTLQPHFLTISSNSLDQYGGRTDKSCAGGARGRFYTQQIGSQWFLCTPTGNAMWAEAAYVAGPQGNAAVKYGSSNAANAMTAARLLAWGFNSNAPYTETLYPWQSYMSRYKMPVIRIQRPGYYGMEFNTSVVGSLSDAVKDLANSTSPYYPKANYKGMVDWGDLTKLNSAFSYMLSNQVTNVGGELDYLIGIAVEDSDQTASFWGAIGTTPFDTQPEGYGWPHGGFFTAVMSPQQQAEGQRWNLLYTDHTVYTKQAWQAYLQKKYGSIGALNRAWGSNYTTFGSSAILIRSESFGITDGVNAAFRHTLATSGSVVPDSIQIYQDGIMIAGDCFHPNTGDGCNPQNGTKWGGIFGPKASGGQVHYSTKEVTVIYSGRPRYWSFVSCSGSSCSARIADYDDPPVGARVGSTIMVRNSNCCNSSKETVTVKSGDVGGFYTYTYTNRAGNLGSGAYPSGGQVAAVTVPRSGHVLTVSYQVNGWDAGGTGLMDEDGRSSHTWLGTDAYNLSSAASNVAADMRGFLGSLATSYFSAMKSDINSVFAAVLTPAPMYVGPDSFGTWATIPQPEVLRAAGNYFGLAIMAMNANYQLTRPMLNSLATNFGKPIIAASFFQANAESACTSSSLATVYSTQSARGAAFYSYIQNLLSSTTSSGANLYVGNMWWQYSDGDGGQPRCTNWGLVTQSDNAYDGHEAVRGTVRCSSPLNAYMCGGETGSYGDVISCGGSGNCGVKAANALWLAK
jgi:hypothetical protein